MLDSLEASGRLRTQWNTYFLTSGDSREPELAGIYGALWGSAYLMLVTLLLCVPTGVAAALYLEEFAPKNRVTDLIEVNVNNLAAVPSIVFGLLSYNVLDAGHETRVLLVTTVVVLGSVLLHGIGYPASVQACYRPAPAQ